MIRRMPREPQNWIRPLIPLKLDFFAESSGEKTEKATPKKKEKAREEGQVAKSQELGTALLFITVFFGLRFLSGYMYNTLAATFRYGFAIMPEMHDFFPMDNIGAYINFLFMQVLIIVAPLFALTMLVGVISNLAQVGWHPTTKPLMPKFTKLNPLSGFKRIFSFRALMELGKSLAKFAIISLAIYNTLSKEAGTIYAVLNMNVFEAVAYVGDLAISMGINVGAWYLVIAIIDIAYTRFKHTKELRMTKQEVKEEYKQAEGNPQIKGQIRQRMREAAMRRMMQDVPNADVIITNPTHYAVALQYDRSSGQAPKVVAKGADHMAQRIKEKARESDVAIVENKPLARTLYATVDIGREIPQELYQSVAEILAYVYKLKNIS